MNNIVIKHAQESEAASIALLARITFSETFGHHFRDPQDLLDYYDQTFSVQKIRNSIRKSNNVFWIAYANELPVAYAKLKLYSPTEFIDSTKVSQLQKIYVLKDFLSRKIGRELQNSMIETARDNESEHLWLSVLKSNQRAIGFL